LEEDKALGSSGSYSWPFVFLIYISELPALLNRNTKILLYAVDTTRTVNSPNPYNYQIIIQEMCYINKLFKANLLSLNLGKKLIGYNLAQ
jgi:hypothetical protein